MSIKKITPANVVFGLLFIVFFAALPLLIVGRTSWIPGWIYAALTLLSIIGSRLLVARKNPDTLAERAQSFKTEDAKAWDKKLMVLVGLIGPTIVLIVSSLDVCLGWSPILRGWVTSLGLVIMILGLLFSTWAFLENKFFSGIVRIQTDRGHYVIDTGPYRFIRHPGYAGAIWAQIGIPVYFNAFWGLIPAVGLIAIIILRTALEDKTLQEELSGYSQYARKTKYRLFPLIW